MSADHFVAVSGRVIEILGVAVMLGGVLAATIYFFVAHADFEARYEQYRRNLGRAILLGLEFLVAGDIINTVAIHPDMRNALTLGVIVLIRTVLSFALETELNGRPPWDAAKNPGRP
jgi:uncharacterized membrane protein